jgi:hypothetical protein
MQLVKNNLLSFIILVLLAIIILQRCEAPKPSEKPKVERDTIWVVKDSLITSKPQVTKTIQIESHDTIINHYIPDTNYAKLAAQYQEVVKELLAKNIHSDSIRIDTNGYVKIVDTVQKNLVVGRSTKVNIRYPIIKETVTIPAKKVTQLYVGGAILGSPAPNAIMGSALLKTRNEKLFGGSLSINTYGDIQYGIHSFWKVKLKKDE